MRQSNNRFVIKNNSTNRYLGSGFVWHNDIKDATRYSTPERARSVYRRKHGRSADKWITIVMLNRGQL